MVLERQQEQIILSLIDQGCGLSSQQWQQIRTGAMKSNKSGGHGIGLSHAIKQIEYLAG